MFPLNQGGNGRIPLDRQLGYEVSNSSGILCQCPENIIIPENLKPIPPINPSIGINPYPYVPFIPALAQSLFAMRNAKKQFINAQVTPQPYISAKIDPNYNRRYTVVPTPMIGLYSVTVFNKDE